MDGFIYVRAAHKSRAAFVGVGIGSATELARLTKPTAPVALGAPVLPSSIAATLQAVKVCRRAHQCDSNFFRLPQLSFLGSVCTAPIAVAVAGATLLGCSDGVQEGSL